MEEQISESKNTDNIEIKTEINNNKFSLLKEIDKIIYKSKNQLEEIQSKKPHENKFYQCDKTLNNNIFLKQ